MFWGKEVIFPSLTSIFILEIEYCLLDSIGLGILGVFHKITDNWFSGRALSVSFIDVHTIVSHYKGLTILVAICISSLA